MAYEQRELSGSLFKNDRKAKDTHADYQGRCLIDGREYYMNAWLKDGKSGKWMSFSFKPADETGKQGMQQARAAAQPDFDDSEEVPF
jgi:hypothetical protein